MKKVIIGILILCIAVFAGKHFYGREGVQSATAPAKQIYYCPMHPHYISEHSGNCPICGMKLVTKENSSAKSAKKDSPPGYTDVHVDHVRQQLMGIKTMKVSRQSLIKSIHAYGYVTHDLELYEAQLKYIDAWRVYYGFLSRKPIDKNVSQNWREYYINPPKENRWRSDEKVRAQEKLIKAEYELIHMGLTENELSQLREIPYGQPWVQPELLFFEKNQRAWIYAQIPESDLGFIGVGQKVNVTIPAYQETTEGVIKSMAPVVDPETRTARVRIELPTYRSELSNNMFVDVEIPVDLDLFLVVPRQAVMDTGLRKIVFVVGEDGHFKPREITTGFEGNDMVAVKSGLKEGETIVSAGNFLLDSESRLEASVMGGAHD